MKKYHFFILIILMIFNFNCKNNDRKYSLEDILECNDNKKIAYVISLKACISCGVPLNIPGDFILKTANYCNYIIIEHAIKNNKIILKNHLPDIIVDRSEIIADKNLYYEAKNKYMPESDSFILLFDYKDSLLFKTAITRTGISDINAFLEYLD